MSKKQKNVEEKKNKESKRKHGVIGKILKVLLIIILLIALLIGGFVGYSTMKNGWGLKGLIQTAVGSDIPLEELDEFQVLILGISEDISAALTDTMIVASYNPKTQKSVLLSIPRDTFIGSNKLRVSSYDKINAVFQKGGAEGVLEKVNKLTGLNVKNYIIISNNALVELVDEIGGVEFNVPMDMNYDSKRQNLHIHLKAGKQKLTGKQAEWLVRFRKNNNGTTYSVEYGNDDYGRMKTQRDFLKAVAKQTLQAKNITKIGGLIDIVKRNVKSNLNWDEVKNYIPYAVEFDMNNVQATTIPGDSARIPAGTGLWFFLADESKTKDMVEELFQSEETEDTNGSADSVSKNIKIEVLNGSGNSKNLTEVTNSLKAKGYNVTKTGTTTSTSRTTIINKNKVSTEITNEIQKILKTGLKQSSTTSSGTADITIILGADYK